MNLKAEGKSVGKDSEGIEVGFRTDGIPTDVELSPDQALKSDPESDVISEVQESNKEAPEHAVEENETIPSSEGRGNNQKKTYGFFLSHFITACKGWEVSEVEIQLKMGND